jgi:hypothetical protein
MCCWSYIGRSNTVELKILWNCLFKAVTDGCDAGVTMGVVVQIFKNAMTLSL